MIRSSIKDLITNMRQKIRALEDGCQSLYKSVLLDANLRICEPHVKSLTVNVMELRSLIDAFETGIETQVPRVHYRKKFSFSVLYKQKPVAGRNPTEIFIETLRTLGLERIHKLPVYRSKVKVVGLEKIETDIDNSRQHFVDGYYIYTNMSTKVKILILKEIVRQLHEEDNVEIKTYERII